MVFHWRLSESKSPQVSKTLLSIPTVFNNAVVLMLSTRPPTSKSSRPFNNPLLTVPKAPVTIGIIVTFLFHRFFNSLGRPRYLSLISYFFQFYSVVIQDSKVDNFPDFLFFFFWLIIIRSAFLAEIRWSICISKSHRSLCVLFTIHQLLGGSNFNFLHISQWITLPIQSCLALYSFCANLLHSLMWLMVSSLLLLIFCSSLTENFSPDSYRKELSSCFQDSSKYWYPI